MMDPIELNQEFWNERWRNAETGWDVGYATDPIVEFMSKYENKNDKILIPGCGNAYEAEFLIEKEFTNIHLIDIATEAIEKLKAKFSKHNSINIICQDFFELDGQYDLMIEQTFFCALPPHRRKDYVKKAADLLTENGRIVGVLFDRNFEKQGPPFGGTKDEYLKLFEKHFEIKTMEKCYNSIPPRAGSEVFIELIKK